MNPRLTVNQQRTICSHLGRVRLQLLYKASVHGYTSAAFHQRCDNHSPTVSVGYNASGFVFGGYTRQPFSQSGQYVRDDQAFLFTLKGAKLLKYPVTKPAYAVRMMNNSGPYFGEDLVLVDRNRPVVYSNPGNYYNNLLTRDYYSSDDEEMHRHDHNLTQNYYNFNAAEMHGNDLNLTECEVYQVEGSEEDWSLSQLSVDGRWGTAWTRHQSITRRQRDRQPFTLTPRANSESPVNQMDMSRGRKLEYPERTETTALGRPWRPIIWESKKRTELMEEIKTYKPMDSSVSQVRVLLVGPVGAGKSSFFNSVNSVFRGHVTSQAMTGSSATSLTTQFRTYCLKDGREGKPLPIILCDTMGLEESNGAGLNIDDIDSIVKGHLQDCYQFNPSAALHSENHGYVKSPKLKNKIHCVAYVIDACKISIMPEKLEEKLQAIRRKINLVGIPQLVLLTKVDEACPLVKQDLRNIYTSAYVKEMMQEVSARLGVPLSCVVPVKNYSEELELDENCDILLLSAIIQMLRFTDNYFDDLSQRLSNI